MSSGAWEIVSAKALTPASVLSSCAGLRTPVLRETTIGGQSVSSVSLSLTLTPLTPAAGQRSS